MDTLVCRSTLPMLSRVPTPSARGDSCRLSTSVLTANSVGGVDQILLCHRSVRGHGLANRSRELRDRGQCSHGAILGVHHPVASHATLHRIYQLWAFVVDKRTRHAPLQLARTQIRRCSQGTEEIECLYTSSF